MIKRFDGEYFFLSNFYECPVEYEGVIYGNNEAAFQAQKTLDVNLKEMFAELSPIEARNLGRTIKLRTDWETIKDDVMYEICYAKFHQNPALMEQLVYTGKRPLEEGNHWGDQHWGTVNGSGKNMLGKILMKIRDDAIKEKEIDSNKIR